MSQGVEGVNSEIVLVEQPPPFDDKKCFIRTSNKCTKS